MQAAAEKLKPVFTAMLADVRALFNLLRLIICFDHRTRRDVSKMLRTLETDAWIALFTACEDLPAPTPRAKTLKPRGPRTSPRTTQTRASYRLILPLSRASTSLRTHTNPFPTPTPDHIYRANFLRRLSRLVHVITNPEPALSSFAKHLARTTRVDPFPPAKVCEDDTGTAGAEGTTPPVIPEKAQAFIRNLAAYENPKDPGAKAGMTRVGSPLHAARPRRYITTTTLPCALRSISSRIASAARAKG
jgi:hypothetical protein